MKIKVKTAQDLFQRERNEWLHDARMTAKRLLRTRYYITIEDVLKSCPRPSYVHRNVTGHVFQDDDFVFKGYTKSRRPISNGRTISFWTLKESVMLPRRMSDRRKWM